MEDENTENPVATTPTPTLRELRELKVDPRIRNSMIRLTESQFKGLEASILEYGIIGPIVLWKGKDIIIDGHHRYEIAMKHGISIIPTVELGFPDIESVLLWVRINQYSKRNSTKAGQMYIIGQTYEEKKKPVGGDRSKYHTMKVEEAENGTF